MSFSLNVKSKPSFNFFKTEFCFLFYLADGNLIVSSILLLLSSKFGFITQPDSSDLLCRSHDVVSLWLLQSRVAVRVC